MFLQLYAKFHPQSAQGRYKVQANADVTAKILAFFYNGFVIGLFYRLGISLKRVLSNRPELKLRNRHHVHDTLSS